MVTLRPKYLLYGYMEPLGKPASPPMWDPGNHARLCGVDHGSDMQKAPKPKTWSLEQFQVAN